MASLIKIILNSLLLLTSYWACVSALNCGNLSAEECKTLFGKAFDEEFKRIHVATTKKMFIPYVEAIQEVSADLPKERSWTAAMHEFVDQVDVVLKKKLDENIDNNEELLKIMNRNFADLDMEMLEPKIMPEYSDKFKNAIEKHGLRTIVKDSLMEMLIKVANKWRELYAQLREKDLAAFAIYSEIDRDIKNVESDDSEKARTKGMNAIKAIAENFDVPYIKGARYMLLGRSNK